jgi:uncharacterized membrane protein
MKNKGEILATILKNFNDCYIFLHNTKEFDVVENIMNEGFVFESQLTFSTDRINPNDHVEVAYFLVQRKDYGSYTVIIAIPKNIYEIYSAVSIENDVGIEDVLTIADPNYSDNDELLYTMSPGHVLGYFNIKTADFYQNRNWDPFYNNCQFRSVLKKPVKTDKK